MRSKPIQLFFLAFVILLGSGCSRFARHNKAEYDLANNIRELNEYASMFAPRPQSKGVAEVPDFDERYLPPPLISKYTIRWYGEPEVLLDELSRAAGFPFAVIGPRPIQPVNIWIKSKSTPLYEILYEVGEQLGAQATLNLFVSPVKQTFRVNLEYPD